MTRREMARLLAWAFLPTIARRAGADNVGAENVNKERRYRADAQVLILSIPILRRSGVGGGDVAWREWREPAGWIRLLEFTGYSIPARAGGLNRLGFIRERSCRDDHAIQESSYFGVMTASPEESAADARKALHSNATEATYTAIQGRIAGGKVETASAHFTGPARLSPDHRKELFAQAEQVIAAAPRKPPEFRPSGVIPAPFLHSLADALRTPGVTQTQYVYAGRLYRLWLHRAADSKAAAYFREHGIIGPGVAVSRVVGKLRRETGGKETEFRLWIEDGAAQPVPLRIDFQPKAYLRLIFEAET